MLCKKFRLSLFYFTFCNRRNETKWNETTQHDGIKEKRTYKERKGIDKPQIWYSAIRQLNCLPLESRCVRNLDFQQKKWNSMVNHYTTSWDKAKRKKNENVQGTQANWKALNLGSSMMLLNSLQFVQLLSVCEKKLMLGSLKKKSVNL